MTISRNISVMAQGASSSGILAGGYGGLGASVSPTTAGNVLFTADGSVWSSTQKIVQGTTVSASGASIDFSSIPSWVKRVTLNFSGISTSGTSPMVVRLGTSGGIVSTGYLGSSQSSNITVATQNWTSGFGTRASTTAAADVYNGVWLITLLNLSTNLWCSSHTMGLSNGPLMTYGAGSVPLGGTLTTVRITTSNGTDTFDAGSVNILYE